MIEERPSYPFDVTNSTELTEAFTENSCVSLCWSHAFVDN